MKLNQSLGRFRYLLAIIMVLFWSTTLSAQKLKFEFKNTPLKSILKTINQQSGYDFVYSDLLKLVEKPFNVKASNEDPVKFFGRFFPSVGINYKIHGKQVVLSPHEITSKGDTSSNHKSPASSDKNESNGDKIKGKIYDQNGLPLYGVSVFNMNTKKGIYSEIDGSYMLDSKSGDRILFSFVGYKSREYVVPSKIYAPVDMILDEDAVVLESVAIIGYGNTQKIKDVTGSIAHLGQKELETAPMGSTIQSMLQGRAAGVNVQIQSASPTSPVSVIIRGQSSLRGDNQPLWVIDGIPEYNSGISGSISNVLYSLNLNDVESIDILKDASSTAIYGSRAANGVIVVTTKSGKEGMKPLLEFSTRLGYQVMDFNGYDYFRGPDYLRFTRAAVRKELNNRGTCDYFTRKYLDEAAFKALNTSEVDVSKVPDLPTAYYDGDTYWMGEMTQNPLQQQYDLTIKGGTKDVGYLANLNHSNMEGIVKTGYSRIYGGRIRLEARINKDIKFRMSASGSSRNASNKDYMLNVLKQIRPDIPIYNPDGTLFTRDAYTENPYTTLKNTGFGTGENIAASSDLEWTIIKGLIFTTKASINYYNSESLEYKRRGSQFNYDGSRDWSRSKSDTKIWDNTLVYANTFGKHDLSASITSSMEKFQSLYYVMSASNFPDDDILNSFEDAASLGYMSEDYVESSMISQIARAQYKYYDRYLATFTIRRDGSSKFGSGKRWGWFPSFGAGWLISNEDFMKNGWVGRNISHMKLRASYGKSGSQNLRDYQWMTMVSSVTYNESPGIYPSNIGNMNLQWEESMMTDIALELELFKSRLRTTIGYFDKKSDNLIYDQTLPPSTAFNYMDSNIASTSSEGYEFSVDADVVKNTRWQLTLNVNGAHNTSRVLSFNNTETEIYPNSYSKIVAGGTIGNWYGYATYKRLFGSSEEVAALKIRSATGGIQQYRDNKESSGDIYFKDLNGDGIVNSDDKTILGTSMPKMFGGFGFQLYVGTSFNLGATFTYAYGNKRLWKMAMSDVGYTGNYNQSNKIAGMSAILNSPYLASTLPNATPYGDGANGSDTFSDYWLYDGSYIRLNSLNASYRFGKEYFRNTLIDNIEITLQASNLLTLTHYPGFDPQGNFSESSEMTSQPGVDNSYYPSAKTFNIGFKFTFK